MRFSSATVEIHLDEPNLHVRETYRYGSCSMNDPFHQRNPVMESIFNDMIIDPSV